MSDRNSLQIDRPRRDSLRIRSRISHHLDSSVYRAGHIWVRNSLEREAHLI